MGVINKMYAKFNAAYFAFVGLIVFFIGLIPAILVHPSFSFFETHISHLGGPTNSLYLFFNICWFITAIFIILFIYGFTLYLQNKGLSKGWTWVMFILALLSAIGIMGMSIFNTEQAYMYHFIFELIFFFTGILYLFGYAVLENKTTILSKWQVLFNIIVAAFFLLYLVLLILNRVTHGFAPEFESLAEWLFLFANLLWFFENGVLMLRVK
jgi:hypothetical membrane protein